LCETVAEWKLNTSQRQEAWTICLTTREGTDSITLGLLSLIYSALPEAESTTYQLMLRGNHS
jgi:hypothetical protein